MWEGESSLNLIFFYDNQIPIGKWFVNQSFFKWSILNWISNIV